LQEFKNRMPEICARNAMKPNPSGYRKPFLHSMAADPLEPAALSIYWPNVLSIVPVVMPPVTPMPVRMRVVAIATRAPVITRCIVSRAAKHYDGCVSRFRRHYKNR
jgi:hypothetical protein